MNMLFSIEFSPMFSFVLAVLLLGSLAGFLALFRIGRCDH